MEDAFWDHEPEPDFTGHVRCDSPGCPEEYWESEGQCPNAANHAFLAARAARLREREEYDGLNRTSDERELSRHDPARERWRAINPGLDPG